MQPSLSAHGVTLVKGEVAGLGVPVNDEKFWRRRVEDIPVDQVFFHTYFARKDERDRKKADKVGKRKGNRGEEGSDFDKESEGGASEEGSQNAGDDNIVEESEESGDGSGSEDGGFDLTSAGKKLAPAEDEAEGESGSEDNDAEESEIWKVR